MPPVHHEADPQAPLVEPGPDQQRPDVEQVPACGPPKERSEPAGCQFVPVEHRSYRPGSRPEGGSPTQGGGDTVALTLVAGGAAVPEGSLPGEAEPLFFCPLSKGALSRLLLEPVPGLQDAAVV